MTPLWGSRQQGDGLETGRQHDGGLGTYESWILKSATARLDDMRAEIERRGWGVVIRIIGGGLQYGPDGGPYIYFICSDAHAERLARKHIASWRRETLREIERIKNPRIVR